MQYFINCFHLRIAIFKGILNITNGQRVLGKLELRASGNLTSSGLSLVNSERLHTVDLSSCFKVCFSHILLSHDFVLLCSLGSKHLATWCELFSLHVFLQQTVTWLCGHSGVPDVLDRWSGDQWLPVCRRLVADSCWVIVERATKHLVERLKSARGSDWVYHSIIYTLSGYHPTSLFLIASYISEVQCFKYYEYYITQHLFSWNLVFLH